MDSKTSADIDRRPTVPLQLQMPTKGNPDGVNFVTMPKKEPEIHVHVAKAQSLEPYTEVTIVAQPLKSGPIFLYSRIDPKDV